MKSAIQTLTDGLVYKKALKILTDIETSEANLTIPDVGQLRELLIGYQKKVLGKNYEAFEKTELDRIDKYLANL